jgi:hypothetical protein
MQLRRKTVKLTTHFILCLVYLAAPFYLVFNEIYTYWIYLSFSCLTVYCFLFCANQVSRSFRFLFHFKKNTEIAPSKYVYLHGIAQSVDKPLISPVFKKPCCWYEVTVEAVAYKGLSGPRWRLVDKFSSLDLFYIKNDSHRFLVCPFAAGISVITEETAQDETINKLSGSYSNELFSRLSVALGENQLRITERRIEVGQSLFSSGFLYHLNADDSLSSLECVNTHLASVISKKKKSLESSYFRWMRSSLRNALIKNTKKSITHFFNSKTIEALTGTSQKASLSILGKQKRPYILSTLPVNKFRNKQLKHLLFNFLGCISSLLLIYAIIFTDILR